MKNLDVDSFCQKIIEDYKKFNLDEVEIKVSRNDSKTVKTRNLKLENIEKSTSFGLVLNVYKGRKQATLKANNLEQTSEKDLLEKAGSMVNLLPEEKYSNMPSIEDYPKIVEDLDNDTYEKKERELPTYYNFNKAKTHLIYDRKLDDGKRENLKMKLPENYNLEEQLTLIQTKVREKYGI